MATPQSSAPAEFSTEERRILLSIAHQSILDGVQGQRIAERDYPCHLTELRGVFTTLYLDGRLRGCVGYAMPVLPLHRAVAETASAAAFDDTRFLPVNERDAQQLKISLSVLSPLFAIRPEEIEVGRHGLLVSMGVYRGLLLPQVPVEHGWDSETFLEQTCRKAGLPERSWRKGAAIEAFTAEVFGDPEVLT